MYIQSCKGLNQGAEFKCTESRCQPKRSHKLERTVGLKVNGIPNTAIRTWTFHWIKCEKLGQSLKSFHLQFKYDDAGVLWTFILRDVFQSCPIPSGARRILPWTDDLVPTARRPRKNMFSIQICVWDRIENRTMNALRATYTRSGAGFKSALSTVNRSGTGHKIKTSLAAECPTNRMRRAVAVYSTWAGSPKESITSGLKVGSFMHIHLGALCSADLHTNQSDAQTDL